VNQEESEQDEVDGTKKEIDSTGDVMHIAICAVVKWFLATGLLEFMFNLFILSRRNRQAVAAEARQQCDHRVISLII